MTLLYHLIASALLIALIPFLSVSNAQKSQEVVPLTDRRVTWPKVPYQVTGANGGPRGPQTGYNLCNSTTEGPNSLCQTLFLNSIDDFCLYSSPLPNEEIGRVEASLVSWCTKGGHGTRIIPKGAITGAQWLYAKSYVQVVGYIDQTRVNLLASDYGGELDPHGADDQGNPLGALVFTNGFRMSSAKFAQHVSAKSTLPENYTQVIEWHSFIGGGMFCLKMCNPSSKNDKKLCEHIYDRYGCTFNILADYSKVNGTFEVCDSDDMNPPGVFVSDGETTKWNQGPRTTLAPPPYTPSIPASSNCQTYSSAHVFAAVPTSTTTSRTSTKTNGGSRSSSFTGQPSQTASASVRKADIGPIFLLATAFLVVFDSLIGSGAAVLF